MNPSTTPAQSAPTPVWSVTSTVADQRLLLSFFGELDAHAASNANVDLIMSEAPPRSVSLDLAGLSSIDSTGVRFVLRLQARARELGATPQIVSWPQHVGLYR